MARESRAGFGLHDISGSQPLACSALKGDNTFPGKTYAEAVKRVVIFSSRSQVEPTIHSPRSLKKDDKASTAIATFTDLSS